MKIDTISKWTTAIIHCPKAENRRNMREKQKQ